MPVFDVAGAVQTPPPYWQRRALRRQMNAQADLAEQQAAGYQDEVAIERSKADTARGNLEQRALEGMSKLRDDQREAVENASAAGLLAIENGADPQEAWSRSAEASGFPEIGKIPFNEDSAKAYMASAEKYREVQAANSKMTVDERFIDGLDIPEDQKEQLKLAIAVKKGAITGTTEFDPGAKDPRTDSQRGAAYQANVESFNESSNVQELITDALPTVQELPGAVGISGKVAVGGSGLLAAMGQEDAANAFAQWMSDATPEEVSAIQTQLQVIRSKVVPLTTGEASSRISDNEREIANRTVGIIDRIQGPADLTKSYPQVVGAMKQLYTESWASKYRIASQDDNIDFPYDLNTREGIIGIMEEYSLAGMDKQSAQRAVTRLRSIQGIQ